MSHSLYKLGQAGCVKVRYGYLLAEVNILLTLSARPSSAVKDKRCR